MMKKTVLSILVAITAFLQAMPQADKRPLFTSWEQDLLYPVEYHPVPKQEYKRLDSIMRIDELMMFANDTMPITPMRATRSSDYSHRCVRTITPSTSTLPYLLVVVDSDTYDSIGSYVNRYAEDVHYGTGCGVKTEVVTNADFRDIKSLLLSHQQKLMGATFVGDIDVPIYKISKPGQLSTIDKFPCDLYYMDLDGEWVFGDNDTIIDHTTNARPEIFVGRISGNHLGNISAPTNALKNYFIKNHNYWIGNYYDAHRALAYTDHDWAGNSSFSNDVQYIYGSNHYDGYAYDTLAQNVTKSGYINKIHAEDYSFVQLACHSAFTHHQFHHNNESLFNITIDTLGIKPLGYNLFCCSACKWIYNEQVFHNGYNGGVYLHSPNSNCLFVVGSTKTGSMLNFLYFYMPLTNSKCVGKALIDWWQMTCGNIHDEGQKWWHYGMVILGDPMIQLVKPNNAFSTCEDTITLTSFKNIDHSNLHYYRAASTINVEGSYSVPAGTHVIFDAPHVNINYGFTCPVGATFEVRQEGCKN